MIYLMTRPNLLLLGERSKVTERSWYTTWKLVGNYRVDTFFFFTKGKIEWRTKVPLAGQEFKLSCIVVTQLSSCR